MEECKYVVLLGSHEQLMVVGEWRRLATVHSTSIACHVGHMDISRLTNSCVEWVKLFPCTDKEAEAET